MSRIKQALTVTLEKTIISTVILLAVAGARAYETNKPYKEILQSPATKVAGAGLAGISIVYGLGYYRGREEQEKEK